MCIVRVGVINVSSTVVYICTYVESGLVVRMHHVGECTGIRVVIICIVIHAINLPYLVPVVLGCGFG